MSTILLLEAHLVQTQIIAKSLHRAGYKVASFCEEKHSYGYHSKYIDEKVFTIPCEGNQDEYYKLILAFIQSHHVSAIIPMSDESAKIIAKHKRELEKYTSVSCPEYRNFVKGYDKNELMKVCKERNVDHPLTIDLSDDYSLDNMLFPAIIKPNITSGGRGMTIVKDKQELDSVLPSTISKFGPCHLQEFIPPGGRQIKVQVLIDEKGDMVCHSVMQKTRWYPVKGGSSCCNISIEDTQLLADCYKVLTALEWRGFADFDVIEDPRSGKLKIMEINPRVPACIKSAVVSGINWAEAIVADIMHKPQKHYEYMPGKILRFLGFDVLWFLKSPNRFKSFPSWFKFFGKDVFYQDLDFSDLGAFIWGTFGNVKKLFSSDFRKSKAGLN